MAVRINEFTFNLIAYNGNSKHILRDLQPYVCTYTECDVGDTLYASRTAWLEHERLAHCRVWQCYQHSTSTFDSQEAFLEHLSQEHTELSYVNAQQMAAFTNFTVADNRDRCPFCLRTDIASLSMHNHMAIHQEHIAAFTLSCYMSNHNGIKFTSSRARVDQQKRSSNLKLSESEVLNTLAGLHQEQKSISSEPREIVPASLDMIQAMGRGNNNKHDRTEMFSVADWVENIAQEGDHQVEKQPDATSVRSNKETQSDRNMVRSRPASNGSRELTIKPLYLERFVTDCKEKAVEILLRDCHDEKVEKEILHVLLDHLMTSSRKIYTGNTFVDQILEPPRTAMSRSAHSKSVFDNSITQNILILSLKEDGQIKESIASMKSAPIKYSIIGTHMFEEGGIAESVIEGTDEKRISILQRGSLDTLISIIVATYAELTWKRLGSTGDNTTHSTVFYLVPREFLNTDVVLGSLDLGKGK